MSLLRSDVEIGMAPGDTRYISTNEQSTVSVVYDADTPINAIGATIAFPPGSIAIREIGLTGSAIDLWTEQPTIDQAAGEIRFSGGSVSPTGLIGPGELFSFQFAPVATGTITFTFREAQMLAHDGKGSVVDATTYELDYFVRGTQLPSPDVNADKVVNLLDFGIVSARLFGTYQHTYDLNRDGVITLADLRIVVQQFLRENGL
jgi:hypothetical protein